MDGEPPTARSIGIVGGGQLAWMMAREAKRLGIPLHVQTPDPRDPATELAASVELADLADVGATRALAQRAERISFENEWLPLAELQTLEREGIGFVPCLDALAPLLAKRRQRELLNQLNLPTPRWAGMEACLPPPPPRQPALLEGDEPDPFWPADPAEGSWPAASPGPESTPGPRLPEGFTFPVVAKQSRGGYDGKGTLILADQAALESHLATHDPEAWILEEQVDFAMELALVVGRDQRGQVECFPLVQTHQRDQVCEWVLFPAPVGHAVEAHARNVAMSLVSALNYVGVMGIEFFYGCAGLQVNEVAPRVHNSGHLTIEACATNQFAQHVRIVAGLPLGPTEPTVKGALMINLLGYGPEEDAGDGLDHRPQREALAALDGACLHWYGKGSRPGRKLGHVTFVLTSAGPDARREECASRLAQVRALWPWPEPVGEASERREKGLKFA